VLETAARTATRRSFYWKDMKELRVGVLSDTHGLLRTEARAFLVGCDYIIHAGDIGSAEILEDLASLAPLIAVRGNNDKQPWASHLAESELVRLGGAFVYMIHDLAQLQIEPSQAGVQAVVSGHSHKPKIFERDGVAYVNPGSCGPRRFSLPISIGEIRIDGSKIRARIIALTDTR
jgi:putative phosphoesterase